MPRDSWEVWKLCFISRSNGIEYERSYLINNVCTYKPLIKNELIELILYSSLDSGGTENLE